MWQTLDIRNAAELTPEAFWSDYVTTSTPVIIRGLVDSWRHRDEWQIAALKRSVDPKELVRVLTSSRRPAELSAMLVCEALARVERAKEMSVYIVDWSFAQRNAHLRRSYSTPSLFSSNLNTLVGIPEHSLKWMYVGSRGSESWAHIDVADTSAWLALLQGRKRWRFVRTADLDAMKIGADWRDLFPAMPQERDSFPRDASCWEAVQEPGDVVWTPPRVIHAVQNDELSISLTHNYVDVFNVWDVLETPAGRNMKFTAQDNLDAIVTHGLAHLPRDSRVRETVGRRIAAGFGRLESLALRQLDFVRRAQSTIQEPHSICRGPSLAVVAGAAPAK